MPGTEDPEAWLKAAEVIYFQAVRLRRLHERRLFALGGVFSLAAGDIVGQGLRVADDAEMERLALDAWEIHEVGIRRQTGLVGSRQAVKHTSMRSAYLS